MLLPAIQYGPWKIVEGRMMTVAAKLRGGADLVEVMTADGMLDTETTPGMLVVSEPPRLPGDPPIAGDSVPHFHCSMPWPDLWDVLCEDATPTAPSPVEAAVFEASLRTSWGVLGLLAHDSQAWFFPESTYRPFMHAALEAWQKLDGVGARYSWAYRQGRQLWSVANNLHYVLANLGVPPDLLRAPLPPEGPRALLKYVRPIC